MRRKTLHALGWVLIALAVPAALLIFAFFLPPQYGETYLGGLSLKYDRLRNTPGKRMILIGGSGTAFDYRCDLLEQEFPEYTAVNFGLYAGLGTTVMLDLAENQLHPGDIVVFSPEQSEQTLSAYFGAEAMWQAADGHPELVFALNREYLEPMIGKFPSFAAAKAKLWYEHAAPEGDGIYARASFNAYGDIVSANREENIMPGGYDANMPISFDIALLDQALIEKINAFHEKCQKIGVSFYYRFCPMNEAALPPEARKALPAFAAALNGQFNGEILGSPVEAILVPGWFYDTNFHLNASGAILNTIFLIRDLKALRGDESPVRIPLPVMPGVSEAALTDGDNSDASYFLYRREENVLQIIGLTDAGRLREKLTVPVSRDGLPVAGFTAETFQHDAAIREIILQSNIRRIDDHSFRGCAGLKRLVLRHESPQSCTVGSNLLSGTDAGIIVPAKLVSAYATNYFWSVYASRIRPDDEAPVPTPSSVPSPSPAGSRTITYFANGGRLKLGGGDSFTQSMESPHLRVNTALGSRYLERDGFVLIGWNTQPDGSGRHAGLGSRIERENSLTLYAEWAPASPDSDFIYESASNGIVITGYAGNASSCVVPEAIGGLPVRRIASGAFRNRSFQTLVLPSALRMIDDGAFEHCMIQHLYCFDSLREVQDGSFRQCPLTFLHVNAATSPKYSGSYFDTFSDKYDALLSIRDQKKIVLFSGSSGRYGYDTPEIIRAFPDYAAVNMGVYAFTNALPQYELIRSLMQKGDILLSAPEFDAVPEQFCVSSALDTGFWAMMESNYDAAAQLDMNRFSCVFTSLGDYLSARSRMEDRDYSVSPASFDDDGNYYPFSTYNAYGDFILPRPNSERDERLRHNIADYTANSFSEASVNSLNEVYRRFQRDGVTVYFSYTPRNRQSLTEESTPEARAALHEYLKARLCVPVITELEDSLYSGVYFWLIDSHLSTEGAKLRTAQIITDLQNALQTDRER